MSRPVITVDPDTDIEDAAILMEQHQLRRLPVIDADERLCGIVSLGDLSREADDDCAEQALEGVSQPGGEHRQ
jgi:CBS-domain-containing membrane protein